MATHSSILAWRIPWTEESGGLQYSPWGRKESDTTEQLTHTHTHTHTHRIDLQFSGVHQSDSVIYIYSLSKFFSIIEYYGILHIVPYAIQ